MKTNEETISSLFERRYAYYIRKKKQRAVVSTCLLVVFSLSALIHYTSLLDESGTFMPMMTTQETTIDGAYVSANDSHTISAGGQRENTTKYNTTRITINELDSVPIRLRSRFATTHFEPMPAEEILSHFAIQLDIKPLFEEYGLEEEDHEHGFYVNQDGSSLEQDFFHYRNADNSQQLTIKLQSTSLDDVYLLSNNYDNPIRSYVCGKEVYIFRWEDKENEELFCEFVYKDSVKLMISMNNMGTSELIELIEYFVIQEPIIIDAKVLP